MLQGLTPIPSDPITLIVTTILSAIGSLFGLFRGGVSGAVKRALEGLRDSLARVGDALMRFAWRIARAAGKVLQSVQALWVRVLRPLLTVVERILIRVNLIIDRVLRPVLEAIERYREAILMIYEQIFRPVILAIETVRRMLAILKFARLGFAKRLDDRLARLEGKVAAPILDALRTINTMGGWINYLLTLEGIIREGPLLASLEGISSELDALAHNARRSDVDQAVLDRIRREGRPRPRAAVLTDLREWSLSGAGPLQTRVERARARAEDAVQTARG